MKKQTNHQHKHNNEMGPVEEFLWRCSIVLMICILLCGLYFAWQFLYIFYLIARAFLQ